MIEVMSCGAGVQSSAMVLMSLAGELPPLEHVIFADTGWEPKAVYKQMDWLEGLLVADGVKVHRVSTGNIKEDCLRHQVQNLDNDDRRPQGGIGEDGRTRWGSMPLFVVNKDGSHGQIRRQCTFEYKIKCIERCVRREILGLQPRQRAPKEKVVRQWIGISWDERIRQRDDYNKFVANWYPFVERKITRLMCLDWMMSRGYPLAPRSACIGCPYHSNAEWVRIKEETPEDWQEAIEFDRVIRHANGIHGECFLHSQRVPLDNANLYTKFDKDQLPLFSMDDECSGMCGT